MTLESVQPRATKALPPQKPFAPGPVITTNLPKPDGIRDTIESIVIAFILAFVFRAFIVEAFVIPTGSMAPGLFGQHAHYRCDLCGFPFAYGIREDAAFDNKISYGTLHYPFGVGCPNCGYRGGANATINAPDNRIASDGGDRILVLKWPYDIGIDALGPKRWDVVVFKAPKDGDTNYIKRLLGLPGEVLEIINGDIYAAPARTVPPDILDALSHPPPPRSPNSHRLTIAQQEQLAKLLRIQRKTDMAQRSLWMTHYNHDYKPDLARAKDEPNFDPPRWQPAEAAGSPWDASKPQVRFQPKDDLEHWLSLTGKSVQDTYGYNNVHGAGGYVPNSSDVGDVRLRFVLFPEATDGHLTLTLQKGSDEFRARIDATGAVELLRIDADKPTSRSPVPLFQKRASIPPLQAGRPVSIEFQNVDYRVSLRIDGREVLATTDSEYSPDIVKFLRNGAHDGDGAHATLRMAAARMPLEIRHLVVERDVSYRSDLIMTPSNSITGEINPYAHYPGWATAGNPIYLRTSPPDYFCCGDNSPQSEDGRMWWEACPMLRDRGNYQLGTVPGDQLIGRAFFVYWPSGYRLSKDTPAIIPNFGSMRIIR